MDIENLLAVISGILSDRYGVRITAKEKGAGNDKDG
jgi:hypothetical protein